MITIDGTQFSSLGWASLLPSLVGGGAGSLVVVVVGGVRGPARGLAALGSAEMDTFH